MHDLWRARVDAAIAKELLRAVEPMAIEAASEAERAPAGPAAVTEARRRRRLGELERRLPPTETAPG
jgi:hypothetical protein